MYLYVFIIVILATLIIYFLCLSKSKYEYFDHTDYYSDIKNMLDYFNDKYLSMTNKDDIINDKLNDIDIFIINLPRSIERKQRLTSEINKYNIKNVEFIEAIDGKNVPENIKYVNNDETLSYGELGCTLSHLKAIKNYYNNYSDKEYVMICEDDITFQLLPYVKTNVNEIINNAPKDWHIIEIYTTCHDCGGVCKNNYVEFSKNNCYLTACYLINLNGAKKILDYAYKNNKFVIDKPNTQYSRKRGSSDTFLMDICNSYAYNDIFIMPINNTNELNSTIHQDHTDEHIKREYMDIKKLYDSYQ